jgi:hypothetical protein
VFVREARWHGDAVLAVVLLEGGGREADGARAQRVQQNAPHLGHLGVGGRAARGIGAEDVRAQRGVAEEGAHVGHHAAALHGVQEFGIALEVPLHAGAQGLQRHAFHVRERAQREVAVRRPAGRDGEAAVADDDGGHPERGGRRRERIPGELGVVVRVDVDDAGRQHEAAGVDATRGGAGILADGRDAPVLDGDGARPRGAAEAVDDGRVVDHEVMHDGVLLKAQSRRGRV